MKYAFVAVAAIPVRKKPDHRSEMVNQLLFGEAVKIIKVKNEIWTKIRSLHDGYEGWVQQAMLLETDKRAAYAPCSFVVAEILGQPDMDNKLMHVPAGSSLPFFENGNGRLGQVKYSFSGKYFDRKKQKPSVELIQQLVLPWLNAPYLWGGRTPMGVDCSGLTQVIFKQIGIDLPRDAWQQAKKGKLVKKLKEVKSGDLAFFERDGRIIHVGIVMPEAKIIHASGKVRMDMLTKKGIVNAETGKLMVKLERIKRLF